MHTNLLSNGALAAIIMGSTVNKPVLQVLGLTKKTTGNGTDRYRLHVSDGLNSYSMVMLGSDLSGRVSNGIIDKHCIIMVDRFVINSICGRIILVFLEVSLVSSGMKIGNVIGNPVEYSIGISNSKITAAKSDKVQAQSSSETCFSELRTSDSDPVGVAPGSPTVAIRDLSIGLRRCTIKACVINKSNVHTWANSKGEGKLFYIDLQDKSGEIRMTGFNNSVDQFYEFVCLNKTYMISNFTTKAANLQFSRINHAYEVYFKTETLLIPACNSELTIVPQRRFTFAEIASIEHFEDKIIDVLGVCKQRGEVISLVCRNGEEVNKRDIVLVDKSKAEVTLTLWKKAAEDFDGCTNQIIAVKGVKVRSFNGKCLTMINTSFLMINPEIPEAYELRKWYDEGGKTSYTKSISDQRNSPDNTNTWWMQLFEANKIITSGKIFASKATVLEISRKIVLYKACPSDHCNTKLVDYNNGNFRCEKCGTEQRRFKWQIVLKVRFGDASGDIWATCFQKHSEIICGIKTDVLAGMHEASQSALNTIIGKALFKTYIVKLRSKMETYNNEERLVFHIVDVESPNYGNYSQKLLTEINENMSLSDPIHIKKTQVP